MCRCTYFENTSQTVVLIKNFYHEIELLNKTVARIYVYGCSNIL